MALQGSAAGGSSNRHPSPDSTGVIRRGKGTMVHEPQDRFAWIAPFILGAVLGAVIGMRIAVATTSALVFWAQRPQAR